MEKKKLFIMGLFMLVVFIFGIIEAKLSIEANLENLADKEISNIDLSR